MKNTRFLAFLMILTFMTGFFLSCNKKSTDAQKFKPRLSADAKCQIRIVGNYKNFEAMEAEFDRFNEFYPEVELTYSYLDNYKSTIKSAISSTSAPDIYMTFPWMLDRQDYKTILDSAEDIGNEEKVGFNLATIRRQLVFRTSEGQVPMIPVLSGSYGMLVNEDIFKKEGLSIPSNYKELVAACKKLKASGYKSPIMAFVDSFMGLPMIYSYFCKSIQNNPEAVDLLNRLDKKGGQYLKPTLDWIENFMKEELIDIEECRIIKDKYNAVIMSFFEGNVPIMLCDTDTVSGTLKRESQSQDFVTHPFKYSFRIFPASDEGSDFVNSVAVGFSVNKNSKNLEMANEFMRFLTRIEELNNLAKIKRLITTSTDYSFDEIYASLSDSKSLYSNELGLMDSAIAQMRKAAESIIQGTMTVEEAVSNYGNF
jgi:multiple sugar transport system substrate-binding protein